jgi:hypothetical protein
VEVGVVKIFFGFDPGEVTGMAAYCPDVKTFTGHEFRSTEISDYLAMINARHAEHHIIHIGVERFVQRRNQRLTEQPAAQRITGAVIALGLNTTLIAPSTAKTMCTDRRLRQLGWYRRTLDGHVNDAARVLFATIAITSPQMIKDLLPST